MSRSTILAVVFLLLAAGAMFAWSRMRRSQRNITHVRELARRERIKADWATAQKRNQPDDGRPSP